jgi:hypothetical protein
MHVKQRSVSVSEALVSHAYTLDPGLLAAECHLTLSDTGMTHEFQRYVCITRIKTHTGP